MTSEARKRYGFCKTPLGHSLGNHGTNWHIRSLATLKLPCWRDLVERPQRVEREAVGASSVQPLAFGFCKPRHQTYEECVFRWCQAPAFELRQPMLHGTVTGCPCQALPTPQICEQTKCFKPLRFRVVDYTIANDWKNCWTLDIFIYCLYLKEARRPLRKPVTPMRYIEGPKEGPSTHHVGASEGREEKGTGICLLTKHFSLFSTQIVSQIFFILCEKVCFILYVNHVKNR